jgi:flagellar biosynthetic protein FlhB
MAEDAGDKTEEPTGKRQAEARSKGMVAKSGDFNAALGLLMGTFLVWIFSDRIVDAMEGTMVESFRAIGTFETIPQDWQGRAHEGFIGFLWVLAPVTGGILIISVIAHICQVGLMWSWESIQPNFGKVFSLGGLSKLLSPASFVEIAKNVAKMLIVGYVGYKVVASHYEQYLMLADMSLVQFCHMIFSVSLEVIIKSTLVLLIVGIADLIYQKRKIHKELMMSKQEVKDEARSSDGDPAVKGKIKQMRMQMHRNLMMKELPKATVVITNPTFIAIAVRYVQGVDNAPVVVGKGKRLMAERIRDTAKQNSIPIIEDKPLARSLFEVAEVGEEIPQEFFAAVAEILAYVYSLKGQRAA